MNFRLQNRLEQFQQVVNETVFSDHSDQDSSVEDGIEKVFFHLQDAQEQKRNLYIIGNGGSASIASHAAIDFLNIARISAHTLHDSATLTCMANDYGYENVFSNIIERTIKTTDILIAISSSGRSENIIRAARSAKRLGSLVITFTGFSDQNMLRTVGDFNFWSDSKDYGLVEISHQFILHNLADKFIQDTE